MIEKWVIDKLNPLGVPGTQYPTVWASSGKSGRGRGGGPPTFWKQGNVAAFACQEKQMPELRRAFLLPLRSLVKCIPDRPMHAVVIVMALRGTRDIKNLQ